MASEKKRKREEAVAHRVCYSTADGSLNFERVFKEESLEEIQNVVRSKLGLTADIRFSLAQDRDGKKIALDDDADFEAFHAAVRESSSTVDILITTLDKEAPAAKRPNLSKTQRPKETSAASSPTAEPVVPPPNTRKRKVSFMQNDGAQLSSSDTVSPPDAPAKDAPKPKRKKVAKERTPSAPVVPPAAPEDVAEAINSATEANGAASPAKKKKQLKKEKALAAAAAEAVMIDAPPPPTKTTKAKGAKADASVAPVVDVPAPAKKAPKAAATSIPTPIAAPVAPPAPAIKTKKKAAKEADAKPVASTSTLPTPAAKAKPVSKKAKKAVEPATTTAHVEESNPPPPETEVPSTALKKTKETKKKKGELTLTQAQIDKAQADMVAIRATFLAEASSSSASQLAASTSVPPVPSTSKPPASVAKPPTSTPEPPASVAKPSSSAKATAPVAPSTPVNISQRGQASVGKSKLRESFVPEQESTPSVVSKGKQPASASASATKPLSSAPAKASPFKFPAMSCMICHGSLHLKERCPVVTQGSASIGKRLEELKEEGKEPKLVEELHELLVAAKKTEREKGPVVVATSLSTSSRGPSWKPTIPKGSRMSEVTVESRDEGSSNDGSDTEDEEDEEAVDEQEGGADKANQESSGEELVYPPDPAFVRNMTSFGIDGDLSGDEVDLEALMRGPSTGRRRKSVLAELDDVIRDEADDEEERAEDSEGVVEDAEEEKVKKPRTGKRRGSSSSADEDRAEDPEDYSLTPTGDPAAEEILQHSEDEDAAPVVSAPPVLSSRGSQSVSLPRESQEPATETRLPTASPPSRRRQASFREIDDQGSSQPNDDGSGAAAFAEAYAADIAVFKLGHVVSSPDSDDGEDKQRSTSSSQEADDVAGLLSTHEEDIPPLPSTSSPVRAVSPIPEEPEPASTAGRLPPSSPIQPTSSPAKAKDVDPIEPAEDLASQPAKLKDRMKLRDGSAGGAPVTPMRTTRSRSSLAPTPAAAASKPTPRVTRATSVDMPPPASLPLAKKRGRPAKKTDEEKEQALAEKETLKVEKARAKEEKDREAAAKREEKKRLAEEKKRLADEKKKGKGKAALAPPPSPEVIPTPPVRSTPTGSQMNLNDWATLKGIATESSPPNPASMIDELRSSSPDAATGTAVGSGSNQDDKEDGDSTMGKKPLFNLSESQPPFPYSQYQTQLPEEEEEERRRVSDAEDDSYPELEQPVVPPRRRPGQFRRMTDISMNRGTLLTPKARIGFASSSYFPSSQPQSQVHATLGGKYGANDDDDEESGSGSDSEKEEKSHIPKLRRAGVQQKS